MIQSLRQEFQRRNAASKRILLILDFDGTLAPIVADPNLARVGVANLRTLRRLEGHRNVRICVLSGRLKVQLVARIPVRGVLLIGEHGLSLARQGTLQRRRLKRNLSEITRGIGDLVRSEPGAVLEKKDMSLTVHFRRVRPRLKGRFVAALKGRLDSFAAEKRFKLRHGKEIYEVLPNLDWGKGRVAAKLAQRSGPDSIVIAIGDDSTDEEMFQQLPEALTVKVGPGKTAARFRLADPKEVSKFLNWLDKQIGQKKQ